MSLRPSLARRLGRSAFTSRSPTGHGLDAGEHRGDTWPDVLATTRRSERTSDLRRRAARTWTHENALLGRRDILLLSTRCVEAPVPFAKRLRRDVD